ncbi:MAG: NAD(P)/FAD-dependent oxidoreductase [Staphylothermus sp.]|nr:NAD(P)/FAD-dependent oxidoreductase [Staphylothermus sp.]
MDTCGKIAVIGAGPAGLLTSFFIRKNDVIIFEEHTSPGKPEHCTGIVGSFTASFLKQILGDGIIDNKYYGVVFHTPHRKIELLLNKPIAYHIKRPFLEEKLSNMVEKLGHRLVLGVKVKPGEKPGSLRVGQRSLQFQKTIAADGSYSLFRRVCFGPIRNKIYGVQAVVKANIDFPNIFHIVYTNIIPDFFGWFVPLNEEIALIGYGTKKHFNYPQRIIKYLSRRIGLSNYAIKRFFGGTIPLEPPLRKPVCMEKIFFIGDSIPLIKPYTGGGLYGITLLALPLAKLLDGEITLERYLNIYNKYYKKFIAQYRIVNIVKKLGYWLPVFFIEDLYRLKMFKEYQFDEHERIAYKSIPLLPYTLPRLVFSSITAELNDFKK